MLKEVSWFLTNVKFLQILCEPSETLTKPLDIYKRNFRYFVAEN